MSHLRLLKTLCWILISISLSTSISLLACPEYLVQAGPWIKKLKKDSFNLEALTAIKQVMKDDVAYKIDTIKIFHILSEGSVSPKKQDDLLERHAQAFNHQFLSRLKIPYHYATPITAQIISNHYGRFSKFPDALQQSTIDLYCHFFNKSIAMPVNNGNATFEHTLNTLKMNRMAQKWINRVEWLRTQSKLPTLEMPNSKSYIKYLLESGHPINDTTLSAFTSLVLRSSAHADYDSNNIVLNRHVFDWKSVEGRITHELTHFIFREVKEVFWSWLESQLDSDPGFKQTVEDIPQLKALILKAFGEYYAQVEDILWKQEVDKSLDYFLISAANQLNSKTHSSLFSSLGVQFIVMKRLVDTSRNFNDANLIAKIIVDKFYVGSRTKFKSWLTLSGFPEELQQLPYQAQLKSFVSTLLNQLSELSLPTLDELMIMKRL